MNTSTRTFEAMVVVIGGSAGAVDQAKGLYLVQAPDSASSPTMPRSVLPRIPQVPHVLSPVAMAETLTRLHTRGLL